MSTKTKTDTATVESVDIIKVMEANISRLESENARLRASLSILDANKIKSDVASLRGDIKAKYGIESGSVDRASINKEKTVMTERNRSDIAELPAKAKSALAYANKVLNAFTTLSDLVKPSVWKEKTSH